jgi:hypothetical protein
VNEWISNCDKETLLKIIQEVRNTMKYFNWKDLTKRSAMVWDPRMVDCDMDDSEILEKLINDEILIQWVRRTDSSIEYYVYLANDPFYKRHLAIGSNLLGIYPRNLPPIDKT